MNNWKETILGEISSDWSLKSAENFCIKVADGTHASPKQAIIGKYLITSKHIKNGKVDLTSAYKISEDDFNEVSKRSKVDQWDVLISMIGTVGEICLVNEETDFAIKNVGLFKCGSEINSKWLYYFLKSKMGRDYLISRLNGTTQQYITLNELRNCPIPIPNSDLIKESIVKILSSLDDKIELLRKENETLEKIAQTIFKEWFVDFTINGEKLKLENGIPEGWRVESIVKVVNIRQGKYLESNEISDFVMGDKKFPIYGGNGIRGYIKDFTYRKPQIVLTCRGNGCGLIQLTRENSTITNSCMAFEYMDSVLSYEFLYFWAKKISFESVTSGSAQPQITITNLSSLDIIIPDEKILEEFNKSMNSLFEKMFLNNSEIQTLSRSRDTLLPKLMSGNVTVNNK